MHHNTGNSGLLHSQYMHNTVKSHRSTSSDLEVELPIGENNRTVMSMLIQTSHALNHNN